MKLSEFIGLPEDHKRSIVMTEGVAIGKRQVAGQPVFLFQLHDFYVETFCCSKTKEILEYRMFQNTKQLSPYLELIRIDHLLK
jgi:hypothetical protein